jgi:hypothetical protein
MDFGSLQTVTAWRLCRTDATRCQGIVVYGPGGFRLVVIENQRIVEWTRVETASALRKHVVSTFKKLLRAGWHLQSTSSNQQTAAVRSARRRERRLLRIAEQGPCGQVRDPGRLMPGQGVAAAAAARRALRANK